MVIDSVLFKDFEVSIWLDPIAMVTVCNVTMVMLFTYHFRCVYPILLILKSTSYLKILVPTSSLYLTRCHKIACLIMGMSIFTFDTSEVRETKKKKWVVYPRINCCGS